MAPAHIVTYISCEPNSPAAFHKMYLHSTYTNSVQHNQEESLCGAQQLYLKIELIAAQSFNLYLWRRTESTLL